MDVSIFWTVSKRFRGGLIFKAHRLCVSHNSRLESNKERESERVLKVPLMHGCQHFLDRLLAVPRRARI